MWLTSITSSYAWPHPTWPSDIIGEVTPGAANDVSQIRHFAKRGTFHVATSLDRLRTATVEGAAGGKVNRAGDVADRHCQRKILNT